MQIAVLSDTHNALPEEVLPFLAQADEVWHLGDVTHEECLEPVQQMMKPLQVVRGNCDGNWNWPWVRDLEREGFLIRLMHLPPGGEPPPGIDLLFHGHTHQPRNGEWDGPTRYYNPGSLGKPRRGYPASFGLLELKEGEPPLWRIIELG